RHARCPHDDRGRWLHRVRAPARPTEEAPAAVPPHHSRTEVRLRMRAAPVFALLLCAAAARAQSSAHFTLQQILSYPYPSELVAAPGGARTAWVIMERGVRNAYEAHGPDWSAHRVTRYTADDGQDLTQLSFARDGRTIVYVRGGDHGANWEESPPPSPANGT